MQISKKTFRILVILIVIALLVLGGAFAYRALHTSGRFQGNLVKNPDHFLMNASYFNGTDGCVLPLQKDQWLKVQMQVDIAIDELFSNIAHYAYNPETGSATVPCNYRGFR